MKTPIRRLRPLFEFVQVPNMVARDYRLSWRARGLLVELLSYPPGWETTIDDMVDRAKREAEKAGGKVEGREAMRAAANELVRVGYIIRRKFQNELGQWQTETFLSEEPLLAFMLQQGLAPGGADAQEPVSGVTSGNVAVPGIIAGGAGDGFPGPGFPAVGFPGAITNTVTNTDEKEHGAPSGREAPPDVRRTPQVVGGHAPSGFAASDNSQPRLTTDQKRTVQAVRDALPRHLDRTLPVKTPRVLADAILEALAGRTVQQLVDFRVLPRWDGYWASKFASGEVEKPVGAVLAMLKHQPECGNPRCDDRRDVDTGAACRACEVRQADKRAARKPELLEPAEVPSPRADQARKEPVRMICASCHQQEIPHLMWDGKPYCRLCLTQCRGCGVNQPEMLFRIDGGGVCPSCAAHSQYATT